MKYIAILFVLVLSSMTVTFAQEDNIDDSPFIDSETISQISLLGKLGYGYLFGAHLTDDNRLITITSRGIYIFNASDLNQPPESILLETDSTPTGGLTRLTDFEVNDNQVSVTYREAAVDVDIDTGAISPIAVDSIRQSRRDIMQTLETDNEVTVEDMRFINDATLAVIAYLPETDQPHLQIYDVATNNLTLDIDLSVLQDEGLNIAFSEMRVIGTTHIVLTDNAYTYVIFDLEGNYVIQNELPRAIVSGDTLRASIVEIIDETTSRPTPTLVVTNATGDETVFTLPNVGCSRSPQLIVSEDEAYVYLIDSPFAGMGVIVRYDAQTGEQIDFITGFAPDNFDMHVHEGRVFAAGGNTQPLVSCTTQPGQGIFVYDIASQALIETWNLPDGGIGISLDIADDGLIVASGSNAAVLMRDGILLDQVETTQFVTRVAISNDGLYAVVLDEVLTVYDIVDERFTNPRILATDVSVSFDASASTTPAFIGNNIAYAIEETVFVQDVITEEIIHRLPHDESVRTLYINETTQQIAVFQGNALQDTASIVVWNMNDEPPTKLQTIPIPAARASVLLNPGGDLLLSAAQINADLTVDAGAPLFFDVNTANHLEIGSVDFVYLGFPHMFTADGTLLIGEGNNAIMIWGLEN